MPVAKVFDIWTKAELKFEQNMDKLKVYMPKELFG